MIRHKAKSPKWAKQLTSSSCGRHVKFSHVRRTAGQRASGKKMDREKCGTVEQWNSGTVEQWNIGTLEQWSSGTMEQWNNGTMEQWNNGTIEQWNSGTVE